MSFQKRKIQSYDENNLDQYTINKSSKGRKGFIVIITILVCFGIVVFAWGGLKPYLQQSMNRVGNGAVNIISKTVGTPPRTDEKWHINAMILGFGGENHAGGYLADSIMIASFDPETGGTTFLSLPRDLYIQKTLGGYGKINGDFASQYYHYEKDYIQAGSGFASKLTQITGIPIQYYFMIDFKGFETLIDNLGGIDIDVQYDIYDTNYPGPNNSYQTFSITQGYQHMDGATALKYARSRYSTSDFARSMRQQQIIKAVMEKVFSFENITSPNKIKELYAQFEQVVHTNMTLDEIIGSMQYAKKVEKFSSFQYAVCGAYRRDMAVPGCLLYNPPIAAFGASVEIPAEATPTSLSTYNVMRDFASHVVYNQWFLVENASIRILNGVDTWAALQMRNIASNTALDLVKMGMRIFDVGNSEQSYQQTTVLVNWTWDYTDTINQMKKIVPIGQVLTGTNTPDGPSLTLVLGNDYSPVPDAERPSFMKY